jgi:hypothetical protein
MPKVYSKLTLIGRLILSGASGVINTERRAENGSLSIVCAGAVLLKSSVPAGSFPIVLTRTLDA